MKSAPGIGLADVQAVYGGPEGQLWELIMGEQIHIGGFLSSMDLAETAGIEAGTKGVDLGCCNGAGMRFLVRFRHVARMQGVDATSRVVEQGRQRCQQAGLADRIQFTLADVTSSGLASGSADFVWGEDAWCYVVAKARLISEAARIVKPGGTIAFTDWIEGPSGLSDAEAERINRFMKFPYMESLNGYKALLEKTGFTVSETSDHTPEFAGYIDLYIKMLTEQLTTDALRIIGFNMEMFQAMGGEMMNMAKCAHEGKFGWGRFIGKKK